MLSSTSSSTNGGKCQHILEKRRLQHAVHKRKPHDNEAVARIHGYLSEQNIRSLSKATGYSRFQLFSHFLRFKALCTLSKSPHGVDREAFGSGLPTLSVEDSLFVDRVFEVVDGERRGLLDWPHFIRAMASLEQGTPEARTTFLFQVYDTSGDGGISRSELKHFFLTSLMTTIDAFVEDVGEIFVEGLFSRIQENERGELTLAEAMRYIERTDEVTDLHGMFGRSMALQGFENVVDGFQAQQGKKREESRKEKEARRIRKLRREAGMGSLDLELQDWKTLKAEKQREQAQKERASHHRQASLMQAAKDAAAAAAANTRKGNKGKQDTDGKSSNAADAAVNDPQELAKMHTAINQAANMSPKARRRRQSVMFTKAAAPDADVTIELKPLGKPRRKAGRRQSTLMIM